MTNLTADQKLISDTLEILAKEEKISLSYYQKTLRGVGHYLPGISTWKNISSPAQEEALLDFLQEHGFTVLREGKDRDGNPFSVVRNSPEMKALLRTGRFRATYITL